MFFLQSNNGFPILNIFLFKRKDEIMERIIITMDRKDGSVLNVKTEKLENTDNKSNINLFCRFLADSYIKHLQKTKEGKS